VAAVERGEWELSRNKQMNESSSLMGKKKAEDSRGKKGSKPFLREKKGVARDDVGGRITGTPSNYRPIEKVNRVGGEEGEFKCEEKGGVLGGRKSTSRLRRANRNGQQSRELKGNIPLLRVTGRQRTSTTRENRF